MGDYQAGETGFKDIDKGLLAVFIDKSGNYLQPQKFRPVFTDPQSSGAKTDIAQDFRVGQDLFPVTFTIPDGATSLLFTVEDIYYSDNLDPDGDFKVQLKSGTDAYVSGVDALNAINLETQKKPHDGGFPFFNLINVNPFISQNWSSQPFFESSNDSWKVNSKEGSSLEFLSKYTASISSKSESWAINFSNFLGDRLNLNLLQESSTDTNQKTNSYSQTYTWNYIGSTATKADDVQIQLKFDGVENDNNKDNTETESSKHTFDATISLGDQLTGLSYQLKGNDSWTYSQNNGKTLSDSGITNIEIFKFQDYSKALKVEFAATANSDGLANKDTLNFTNLVATYGDKSYFLSKYTKVEPSNNPEVDLIDVRSLSPYFINTFLPNLPIGALQSSENKNSNLTTPGVASSTAGQINAQPNVISPTQSSNGTSVTSAVASSTSLQTNAQPTQIALPQPSNEVKQINSQLSSTKINSDANETFQASPGEFKFSVTLSSDKVSVISDDNGKTWKISSSQYGVDTLLGFHRIQLSDKSIALDFAKGDSGYGAATMIGAAFGKSYIATYFGAAVSLFDNGKSRNDISKLIVDNKFIESVVGPTNEAWVKHVYKNVVGVDPDPFTLAAYAALLSDGTYTRTSLLTLASEVPLIETQIDLAGLQTKGLSYAGLL